MALIDYFDRGASHFPDRDCLVDSETTLSFHTVAAATHQIAGHLAAIGIAPGDRVATLSQNTALGFLAILGVLRADAVWVPLNARGVLDEHVHLMSLTGCTALFYERQFAPIVAQIRASVPGLKAAIPVEGGSDAGDSLQSWLRAAPIAVRDRGKRPDELATIFSTGGTTGKPKGARWTDRVWEAMIGNFCAEVRNETPPVHLMVAPMSHAAGVVAFPLLAQGATTVLLRKAAPRDILAAIERWRVTTLFLPPTVIYMLLAQPDLRRFDYRSLRHLIYAAAPMSVEKLRAALDVFGPVMLQTFGQAEAPMVCTILTREDHTAALARGDVARLASCGRAGLHTAVAIMDDDGRLLGPRERGEIVVRGSLVMDGYFDDQAATAEASRFGWHHTGDVGFMDEERYVYIVDRKRDMIISGGFNVYPNEIEQVLWSHPAVQDCAVIGVPDETWGEAVMAIVELKPAMHVEPPDLIAPELIAPALIALCKDRLGSVKAPKRVEIWPSLPRSAVGKVLKREIRARFWSGRDRAI